MFVSEIIEEVQEILATADKAKAFRTITQAVQSLMDQAHWFHQNREVDVCTGWDGVTVTLPRGVEIPLAVNVDGSPTYFRNRLFQFHVNKGGMYNTVEWAWDDRGMVSTLMDIRQPSQLVAVAEHNSDVGLKIRVIGTDSSNRALRTQAEDGTLLDGMLVPVHSQQDFAFGTIAPDGVTIQTREVAVSPLTQLTTTDTVNGHYATSGEPFTVDALTTGVGEGLTVGSTYYASVVDDLNIQLHANQLDAIQGINPVLFNNINSALPVVLNDNRLCDLNTVVRASVAMPISIDSPNEVVFPSKQGSTTFIAPSPIIQDTTYFAIPISTTDLAIYESISDAISGSNQIRMTGSSGSFAIDIRKAISPQTKLIFSVAPQYALGDSVQVYTNGGTLPAPLIAGQTYYIGLLQNEPLSCTLHTNYADAIAGTNSINFTTLGSGINSVVKLITATAAPGNRNQIAANFSLPNATGSGASAIAVITGPVTSASFGGTNTGYTSAPTVTFSDIGGIGYTAVPTVLIVGGTTGVQATATATMATDAATGKQYVASVAVSAGNSGYSAASPPAVVFSGGGLSATGFHAKGVAVVNGAGAVTGVTLTGYGSGASAYASINTVSQAINAIVITSAGSGYAYPPRVALSAGNANAQCSITTSFVTAFQMIDSGYDYTSAPAVYITGGGGTGASGTATLDSRGIGSILVTAGGINYNGATVVITDVLGGSGSGATATVVSNAAGNLVGLNILTPGSGYSSPVYSFSKGSGASFTTKFTGVVTGITVVTEGTGYSYAPTVSILPSTGIFVQFSSTGTLPSPLQQGATYRAEGPSSNGSFTIKNPDFSDIIITSTGSGTLYLALTRAFGVGFTGIWYGDFSGISSTQPVFLGSDYIFPITSPSVGVGSIQYYIGKTTNGAYIYVDPPSVTNRVPLSITALGTGQSYFAYRATASAAVYNSEIIPFSIEYLQDGMPVYFASSGTLPAPLSATTLYSIKISGNSITVYLSGSKVTLTSLTVGQLRMVYVFNSKPKASTEIVALKSIFETGQQVTARPNIDDSLPGGLSESTALVPQYYYIRRFDASSFQLYDTYAHAINTSSVTGLVKYQSVGDSVKSTFFIDSLLQPTLAKVILHVEKPKSVGYISLYAFDYGRSNDMTLIGQYHPDETNPKYRRIRIGRPCAWARILYRVQAPVVTSVYDYLPIENVRAIIAAVHAVDLENKDFFEQAQKYWATAVRYLQLQTEAAEGHAMSTPQINNITYGDGQDPIMF